MIDKLLADKIVEVACKMVDACVKFRQPRFDQIKRAEDLYANRVKKSLKGRFNIPVPVMGGFVDALMSKIDDPLAVNFGPTEKADYMKAKKGTAMWKKDSEGMNSDDEEWNDVDLDCKKLAIFSGFGVYKFYAESNPKYQAHLETVDYYDLIFEPQGGPNLERHLYKGQQNIFKTKTNLKDGLKDGFYDSGQISKLLFGSDTTDDKVNQDEYKNKQNRMSALGLNFESNAYVGQQLYRLTELILNYQGSEYYILFDYNSRIWVRCALLKDVFGSELAPLTAWHTHRDRFNFMSKAPVDDLVPVAESIYLAVNNMFESWQKKNWNHKLYDQKMITKPDLLKFRPDGLTPVKVEAGQNIQNAVYELRAGGEINGTFNLISFLQNITALNTGVNPSSQGMSEENKKVGVLYSDLKQVADRMGLYNKSYSRAWKRIARRYIHGLKEHCPEGTMIKVIGTSGIDWHEIKKNDFEPDFDISLSGGNSEEVMNMAMLDKKNNSLGVIIKDPQLKTKVGTGWLTEEILRNGGYNDEQIKVAMDTQNEGYQEIIAMAADENQRMLAGEKVEPNRKALAAHLQEHLDFAQTIEIEKPELYRTVMAHFNAEVPIAAENTVRQASGILAKSGASLSDVNLNPPRIKPSGIPGGMSLQGMGRQITSALSPQ